MCTTFVQLQYKSIKKPESKKKSKVSVYVFDIRFYIKLCKLSCESEWKFTYKKTFYY
jgi:uncharacterized protein (DUF362 family)